MKLIEFAGIMFLKDLAALVVLSDIAPEAVPYFRCGT